MQVEMPLTASSCSMIWVFASERTKNALPTETLIEWRVKRQTGGLDVPHTGKAPNLPPPFDGSLT